MLARSLFELRGTLAQEGIMFAYCGYITESVRTAVGDALKQKLAFEDTNTKTVRSVFAVFVEQMQNIIRYSAEKVPPEARARGGEPPEELRFGVLTIGQQDGDYIVRSGNLVHQADVERIRARLARIQIMDKEQLKAFYKEQLRSEVDEHSKGAGIGFVEIARRASRPIRFDFTPVDAEHAFFALEASI